MAIVSLLNFTRLTLRRHRPSAGRGSSDNLHHGRGGLGQRWCGFIAGTLGIEGGTRRPRQISPECARLRATNIVVSVRGSLRVMAASGRTPPVPAEKYDLAQDLLGWMQDQFDRFGDIFRASIYGTNAYVTREPRHAQHVLRENWQNYTKGQAIKRIGLLLGNGLMVSEGEFWKSQRQMIQPAFHDEAIGRLMKVITTANVALLKKWTHAAQEKENINITSDISHTILKVVLISIFGEDYELVAPNFNILSDESARNLQFAQTFRPLGKMVIEVANP